MQWLKEMQDKGQAFERERKAIVEQKIQQGRTADHVLFNKTKVATRETNKIDLQFYQTAAKAAAKEK